MPGGGVAKRGGGVARGVELSDFLRLLLDVGGHDDANVGRGRGDAGGHTDFVFDGAVAGRGRGRPRRGGDGRGLSGRLAAVVVGEGHAIHGADGVWIEHEATALGEVQRGEEIVIEEALCGNGDAQG